MCLMCAFDIFLENELSNCVLSISLAVYLFLPPFWGVCGLQSYLPL